MEKCCFLCATPNCEFRCPKGHYYCCQDHGKAHALQDYCYPFEIAHSQEFGRFYMATRDIQPLELIVIDQPAVLGPASKTKPICLECLKGPLQVDLDSSDKCLRCPQCFFPLCSEACLAQRTLHSDEECRILSASGLGPTVLLEQLQETVEMVYCCIFLLRIWLMKCSGQESSDTYRRLDFLMDGNTKDLMDEDSFTVEIANIMQAKMGLPVTREEIVKLMGIKRTNASTLLTVGLPGATALYPVYNLMNSFCTCNTRVSIEEKQGYNIVVRAQTYIKKGQQITTRYLPPWEGQPKRVDQLWKHWQFICHCDRCKDPSEFGTYFSAIKCKKCNLNGYWLPMHSNKIASPWICDKCERKVSHNEIEEKMTLLDDKIKEWMLKQPHENWPELLSKLNEDLHSNHYLIFGLKKKIVSTALKSKSLEKLEQRLQFCEDVGHLIDQLDPGVTMQRAFILKNTAMTRMEIVKALKDNGRPEGDQETSAAAPTAAIHAKKAMEELRMVAACLKSRKP